MGHQRMPFAPKRDALHYTASVRRRDASEQLALGSDVCAEEFLTRLVTPKQNPQPIPMPTQSQSQSQGRENSVLHNYQTEGFFDELVEENGLPRPDAQELVKLINSIPPSELVRRQRAIERTLYQMGITFTVYSDSAGTEKIMPFDIVPRIISAVLWHHIEAGLKQRIKALNCFLSDVYSDQQIIKEGIVPRELIDSAPTFLPECMGLKPFNDVWCHITGTDLVRDDSGAV